MGNTRLYTNKRKQQADFINSARMPLFAVQEMAGSISSIAPVDGCDDPAYLAAKIRVADEQSRKLKLANDEKAGRLATIDQV